MATPALRIGGGLKAASESAMSKRAADHAKQRSGTNGESEPKGANGIDHIPMRVCEAVVRRSQQLDELHFDGEISRQVANEFRLTEKQVDRINVRYGRAKDRANLALVMAAQSGQSHAKAAERAVWLDPVSPARRGMRRLSAQSED